MQTLVTPHFMCHLGEREINCKKPEPLETSPKLPLFCMIYTLSQTWKN